MKNIIHFFGYGANRSPEMIKAIIGRVPVGHKAKIRGFDLCVQSWNEIKKPVKKVLSASWNNNFRTYFLRPTENYFHKVVGTMWEITPMERKLIDNWEMTGEWYKVYFLTIEKSKNNKMQIEIQVIDDHKKRKAVNGLKYKTFLNSKEKMIKIATLCRKEYLDKYKINMEKYYEKWISAISKDKTSRTIKRRILKHAKEIYWKDPKIWSASMRNLIEIFDKVYKSNPSIKLKTERLRSKYEQDPGRYTPPPLK